MKKTYQLFSKKIQAFNIRLTTFGEDLVKQEADNVAVDRQVPAGGGTAV